MSFLGFLDQAVALQVPKVIAHFHQVAEGVQGGAGGPDDLAVRGGDDLDPVSRPLRQDRRALPDVGDEEAAGV